jgi:hypothetical protein
MESSPLPLGLSDPNIMVLWTLAVVMLSILYVGFNTANIDKDGHKIPHGPRGLPILGNIPFCLLNAMRRSVECRLQDLFPS